ncbi:MAG: hypothetical protein PHG08_00780 [Bacilli bacterium]|nr:hypothetical protein [Bacilli bacterium]
MNEYEIDPLSNKMNLTELLQKYKVKISCKHILSLPYKIPSVDAAQILKYEIAREIAEYIIKNNIMDISETINKLTYDQETVATVYVMNNETLNNILYDVYSAAKKEVLNDLVNLSKERVV